MGGASMASSLLAGDLHLLLTQQREEEAVVAVAVVDLEEDLICPLSQRHGHALLLRRGGARFARGEDEFSVDPQLTAVVRAEEDGGFLIRRRDDLLREVGDN